MFPMTCVVGQWVMYEQRSVQTCVLELIIVQSLVGRCVGKNLKSGSYCPFRLCPFWSVALLKTTVFINFVCSILWKHTHNEAFFSRLFSSRGRPSWVLKRTEPPSPVTLGCNFLTQGHKIFYSARTMRLMSFICQVEWKVWTYRKRLLKGFGSFSHHHWRAGGGGCQ